MAAVRGTSLSDVRTVVPTSKDVVGRCCGDRGGWDRGHAVLVRVPTRTLAMFANEQPAGKVVAGSATRNAGGGCSPGWQVGADVGGRQIAPRGRQELGHAAVTGHEPPGRSERSRMNAPVKTFGSPLGGAEHHPGLCFNKCAKNSGHYPIRPTLTLNKGAAKQALEILQTGQMRCSQSLTTGVTSYPDVVVRTLV